MYMYVLYPPFGFYFISCASLFLFKLNKKNTFFFQYALNALNAKPNFYFKVIYEMHFIIKCRKAYTHTETSVIPEEVLSI